jgi:hypothetical protein
MVDNIKLGRNDPCWCGSGLKHKKCHLDRERASPLTIQQIVEANEEANSSKACLAERLDSAPCRGKAIKAHSLSRKGTLERIARNRHVYGFRKGFAAGKHGLARRRPELIGVRDASTFTGFCEGHDNKLFTAIDSEPLGPSRQQIAQHGYRSLCRELLGKINLGRPAPWVLSTSVTAEWFLQIGRSEGS